MALADAFDMAYTIKFDLQAICHQQTPLTMYTDSLSLFDVLTKASMTTEKRLMIDIQCIKDFSRKMEVDDIAYVKSEYDIADPLTKIRLDSILIDTLRSNKLNHPVGQWMNRGKVSKAHDFKKGGSVSYKLHEQCSSWKPIWLRWTDCQTAAVVSK